MAISKVIFKSSADATPEVWMDTTDKTADSGNMLNGTTALKNDGTTATGNIQSQAAQTIYPSTSDQTIASGKYLTGTQTVKGVLLTNLIAANIADGVTVKVGDSADDDRIASITGTHSGGGGLEYEAGTYTPAEDIAQPTIYFLNSHTSVPMMIMFADATGTEDTQTGTNYGFTFNSFHSFTGEGVPSNNTENRRYGLAASVYRGTTANPMQTIFGLIDLDGASSTYAQEHWATANSFSPNSDSTTKYWRANRTYSWIAVWPPAT